MTSYELTAYCKPAVITIKANRDKLLKSDHSQPILANRLGVKSFAGHNSIMKKLTSSQLLRATFALTNISHSTRKTSPARLFTPTGNRSQSGQQNVKQRSRPWTANFASLLQSPMHCQKYGTRWHPRMGTRVAMAAK